MKKIVWVFLIYFLCIYTVNAETSIASVKFIRCVDGDTAVFNLDEEEIKFRFLAIDTPETVHPAKDVEVYGKNASEYTCNKLSNAKEIVIEYENSNKTDKYGRSLGWIWVDGSLLQKELVSVGYAEVAYIYGTYRYTESLCLVQKEAKNDNRGLWNEKKEEGYCSTVDLNGVEDNIDYKNIGEKETLSKEEQKLEEVLKDLNNVTDKVSDFTSENKDLVSNIYFYLMIGAAIISIIYKQIKK